LKPARQILPETLSGKNPSLKRAGGVALRCRALSSNSSTAKKKKKRKRNICVQSSRKINKKKIQKESGQEDMHKQFTEDKMCPSTLLEKTQE
jgi:hypothetical protein